MKGIKPEKAYQELKSRAKEFKEKDLNRILEKRKRIEKKMMDNETFGPYLVKAKSMFSLIRDYRSGEYRQVPWKTIAAVGGALLYVLTPIDLIPDFIPVIGLLDDAGVLAACLKLVGDDLEAYEEWRAAKTGEATST